MAERGAPKRIQRKRTKGWRMPEGAVNCTRPGKWGNPFTVKQYGLKLALFNFRQRMRNFKLIGGDMSELRGKDLACWCHLCEKHKDGKPLDKACLNCAPCHVDPLGEIANG